MAGLPPITQLAGNHRSTFEGYWSLVDKTGTGKISASTAAEFLKKSQLREPVLHKIWNLSDPSSSGCLDKQGFFMSLRLVAASQAGKEPHAGNIALTDPPPRFVGVDPTTLGGSGKWSIEKEEQTGYEQLFQSLKPVGGLLSGGKAKPVMLASNLPLDVLGKVWNMSDIDKDGCLDKDEFAVSMKLISLVQAGETLPPTLPVSLIPPSKVKQGGVATSVTGVTASIATTSLGEVQSPRSTASPVLGSPAPSVLKTSNLTTSVDWVVTSEIKSKYDSFFQGIDSDQDGYVSGEESRSLFMASNLPQPLLAHVWNLCDIENTGRLNSDQFALAMFLIAEKVRGKEVPKELTPAMIPPSLRKQKTQQTTPPSNTPTHSSSVTPGTGWVKPTPDPTWNTSSTTFGTPTSLGAGLNVSMATSVANTSIAWSTPTSAGGSTADTASGFDGFGSDFSSIQELDTVSKEVDTIRKEKTQLSEEIKTKQELIHQTKRDVEALQVDVDATTRQREDLERERTGAQGKLDELDREKARVDGEVAELKQKCEDEQREIERLKQSLTEQELSNKSQTEELNKLREQLEVLKREEKEYKAKVEVSRVELDKVQKAHQNIQNEMSQVRQKINSYKEEHQALTNTLTLYPPVSTPSSTPSSSVININDIGLAQLSAELTTPHVSEPDAISARATAGSSSPVSSISGFSTNSHLDDGGDDSAGGGGAKLDDNKGRSDPFSSNQSNDPFAAFSIPTGDPFSSSPSGRSVGGEFSGKPSDLSAFDPFDPFKTTSVTSTSSADNLFKSDPFGPSSIGGVSQTPGRDPPTFSIGSTTDPFSGQDPFSLDPFGSTQKAGGQSPGWGSSSPFPVDPFASQAAPSDLSLDPFASSDPFSDDPFSSKVEDKSTMDGGASNSFQTKGGQSDEKKKVIKVPDALPKPGPLASNVDRLRWAQRESEREETLRAQRQQDDEEALAAAIRESMKS